MTADNSAARRDTPGEGRAVTDPTGQGPAAHLAAALDHLTAAKGLKDGMDYALYTDGPNWISASGLRRVLAELADARGHVAESEEPIEDVVQLVIPAGPLWDTLRAVLKRMGLLVAGPIPVDDPIKTYVLQPIDWPPAPPTPVPEEAR